MDLLDVLLSHNELTIDSVDNAEKLLWYTVRVVFHTASNFEYTSRIRSMRITSVNTIANSIAYYIVNVFVI